MSWRAAGYVKGLDGVSRSEKLLLLILADYYNDELGCAFPSVTTLAKEALLGERRVYALLRQLQQRGFLRVVSGGGRQSNRYYLPGLEGASNGTPATRSPLKSDQGTPDRGIRGTYNRTITLS